MNQHGQRFAAFTALFVPAFLVLSGWGLARPLTGAWFIDGRRVMWAFGAAGVVLVLASMRRPTERMVRAAAVAGAVGALGRAVHQVAYDAPVGLRVISSVLWVFLALCALRAGWVRLTTGALNDPPSA